MKNNSLECQLPQPEVSVYECEVRLKFRLIEEKGALNDQDELMDRLLEAFTCGTDDYLDSIQADAEVREIQEIEATPRMRRQLIRLRNSLA